MYQPNRYEEHRSTKGSKKIITKFPNRSKARVTGLKKSPVATYLSGLGFFKFWDENSSLFTKTLWKKSTELLTGVALKCAATVYKTYEILTILDVH